MRKHHNKLYYGKFRNKNIFRIPNVAYLWPTTDQHLLDLKQRNSNVPHIVDICEFIMKHRKRIKFRVQHRNIMIYSDEKLAKAVIEKFWDFWIGAESVDPKFTNLTPNTVGFSRLPHGKYQYQIYLKKDAHTFINDMQKNNLRDFIERNIDNCYVPGYAIMDYLEDKCQYCFGGYFYVTQERYITPIYMMAQEAIDKVIKYRKVKNESNKKTAR